EYQVYAQNGTPDFKGNPRTAAPDNAKLGDYDTKICGFNLEYFMNRDALQRTRISKAIRAIDADIYGFVEVGGGTGPVRALVEELDKQRGAGTYDFVRWTGYASSSADYTCNHIVYDSTKWEPYRDSYMISSPSPVNRKLIQAFRNKKTGFVFIFSINHFKAKSGTGTGADADQGDGQGIYNHTRTQEAKAVLNHLDLRRYYYGTENILVMGDLNAMYREDPIRVFTDAGYENQTNRFNEAEYSYCFDDYVQYLDYSLASPDMRELVTGATVWHINSDEPSFFDYDRDATRQDGPYRCSDHEPVIVGFVSPAPSPDTVITANEAADAASLVVRPNPASDHFTFYTPQAGRLEVRAVSGAVMRKMDVEAGENTLEVSSWR
ncbi:MAG: endonuclease/exonuclease/phosphatase family protein, partial [Bacteroidales bacterium]|nr:endonuclease/exonuclease/phosphatase family protein [Bacteroidales bacterium]